MQLAATTNSVAMMDHAFQPAPNATVAMTVETDLTKSTALPVGQENSSAQQGSALTKIESAIDMLIAEMEVTKRIAVSLMKN
jgi:hypothetical protein